MPGCQMLINIFCVGYICIPDVSGGGWLFMILQT
jgi:hypothetical protein